MRRDFCDSGDGYRTGSGVCVVVNRRRDPGIGEGDMVGRREARGVTCGITSNIYTDRIPHYFSPRPRRRCDRVKEASAAGCHRCYYVITHQLASPCGYDVA